MLPVEYRQHFFWLLVAVLIALAYSPSINGPYILDDTHTFQSNAFIQSLSGFDSLWTTGRAYSSNPATYGYRPVTSTVSMVGWWIGGGATWPFHLLKIFLFWITCFLLSKIWRQLVPSTPPEVLAAAILLFALNPVHSQVVSYISQIATQMAGLLICTAILGYLRYRKLNSKPWYFASLACVFLAVLSKEEGIVVVGLIPVIEIYLRKLEGSQIFSLRGLGPVLTYLVPGLFGVGLLFWMFEPTQNLVRSEISVFSYFMTQWRAYLRYFAMYFYSYSLNGDNLEFGFSANFLNVKVLGALILNLVIVAGGVFFWRRQPAVTLALVWFYIGISPASSVVVLSEPVNDHRAFIGYLGFALISLVLLSYLRAQSRQMFLGAVAIVVCAYGAMTFQRGQVWRSTENFWEDVVAKNPSSARAHNNLGLEMIHQKKYPRALELLSRCSELKPMYAACYINRAVVYSQTGRDAQAEVDFETAAKFDSSIIPSRFNWAQFLAARGQFSKSQILLSEADQMAKGQNFEVRLALIEVLRQLGETGLSQKLTLEAVSTFGNQPQLIQQARSLGLGD